MSALVIGKRLKMSSLVNTLIEIGFDDIECRICDPLDAHEVMDPCGADALIVVTEGMEKSEVKGLCKKAIEAGNSLVLW